MKIFHYCAEILKFTPLFESCKNSDLTKQSDNSEGAIFNDFDNEPGSLIDDNELHLPLDITWDEEMLDDTESDIEIDVAEKEIEQAFLEADDDDPLRFSKDHNLFDSESEPSDYSYKNKVTALIELDDEEWEELPIYDDDENRSVFKNFLSGSL